MTRAKEANEGSEADREESKHGEVLYQKAGGGPAAMSLISKAAGVLANLIVVLDSNLFAIPPEKIRDVSVHTTIIAGKIVYHGNSN